MTPIRPRNCKIVATLGPASDPLELIKSLFDAGADAFRINFSHGEHSEHKRRIENVRSIEADVGRPIPIIADLQGPKIRVGQFPDGEVNLDVGQIVELEVSDRSHSANTIPIPHPELLDVVQPNDVLRLDDGRLQLTIVATSKNKVTAKVDIGGTLGDRKGINIPGRSLPISSITDKDRTDLAFALESEVDYVALSFVQRAEDIREAQALIDGRAAILAKIEKPAALDNLDEIIDLADVIMVARGDLGVELSLEQVPIAQRRIIKRCRDAGKPVIVATQMLESMIAAPAPTRAEASDVATAVYQGADAVMLSAESAVGRHPQTAVAIMDRLIGAVEDDPGHWSGLFDRSQRTETTLADAISHSARDIAQLLDCQAILAFTNSGSTAIRVSRERPHCKVLGLTPNLKTARQLSLVWGLHSVVTDDITSFQEMVGRADSISRQEAGLKEGDLVIVTAGIPFGRPGTTNTLKIMSIGES